MCDFGISLAIGSAIAGGISSAGAAIAGATSLGALGASIGGGVMAAGAGIAGSVVGATALGATALGAAGLGITTAVRSAFSDKSSGGNSGTAAIASNPVINTEKTMSAIADKTTTPQRTITSLRIPLNNNVAANTGANTSSTTGTGLNITN